MHVQGLAKWSQATQHITAITLPEPEKAVMEVRQDWNS